MNKHSLLGFVGLIAISSQANAVSLDVDFTDISSLDITSNSLVTLQSTTPLTTYYYEAMTLNLGNGLELSISATAYDNNGTELANNGNRVVYYDTLVPETGLGITSVTQDGNGNAYDDGIDGSIDIDSYASADSGNDALIFTFNQEVDFTNISLYLFEGDDVASLSVLAGEDAGDSDTFSCSSSPSLTCVDVYDLFEVVSGDDLTGSVFELRAADYLGLLTNNSYDVTEFRLAGLSINYDLQSVPEPATIALFSLGLVGLGWNRRKQQV
jgi:hypothetical protein